MWRAPVPFLRPPVAVPVFLLAKLVQSIVVAWMGGTVQLWGMGILAMLVYGTISWFALRRHAVSIWALSIIMVFEGVSQASGFVSGFGSAPFVNALPLAVSVYVILGGLVLFTNRERRGRPNG